MPRAAEEKHLIRVVALTCLLTLMVATTASAGRYRSDQAGHPLRILAYALHPVGVILDYLIFRPAWTIAQYEPLRTLVGMEPSYSDEPIPGATENPFLQPYGEQR